MEYNNKFFLQKWGIRQLVCLKRKERLKKTDTKTIIYILRYKKKHAPIDN